MSRPGIRFVRFSAFDAAAGSSRRMPIAHLGRLLPAQMRNRHAASPAQAAYLTTSASATHRKLTLLWNAYITGQTLSTNSILVCLPGAEEGLGSEEGGGRRVLVGGVRWLGGR